MRSDQHPLLCAGMAGGFFPLLTFLSSQNHARTLHMVSFCCNFADAKMCLWRGSGTHGR
ncbi:hypothetical protein ApDm4_1458 [Acetobacter pomorum]|nr:hypothetical protein ApDm4_1458 [Acetobacter pomorum]